MASDRPSLLPRRALLALALTLAGCQKPPDPAPAEPPGPPWFRDVTAEVGLDFVHDAGPLPSERFFMPQVMGSGAALFDFDNDGRLDIYLIHNGGPKGATNRLYHQEKDGRFTDVSKGSGLDVAGYGMGVAVGDMNNDGLPDVLLTEYDGIRLFLNKGGGRFVDVTREAGLENRSWATSAAFFDYDRDGWLDLVVVNYVAYDPTSRCKDPNGERDYCGPNAFAGTVTRLFHNRGRASGAVRFEDVTASAGLTARAGPGLGVFCADFDGDHWPDILVANDGKPNFLWINQRDGTFRDEGRERGLGFDGQGSAGGNMGIAVGDVDGDGLLDVFITHLTEETHTLWRQGPRGRFQDRTALAGLGEPRWRGTGFGTILADFDHDGSPDIAVVNGRVRHLAPADVDPQAAALGPYWSRYAERNQLFANDGSGRFRDISADNDALCGTLRIGRGLACGDLDGDGALDLVVNNLAGPARVYRNVTPRRGHWLLLRVVDPALGGRDAYGAEVTVRAGGRRWKRWVNPAYSYLCSNDPRAHFGLGSAERVDAIEVLWPDGTEEYFPGQPVDRLVLLRKGAGKAKPSAESP
jgi:hypothetical protein